MNGQYCEFEPKAVATACGGARDQAILDHARNCQVCSEVLSVARLLGAAKQLSVQEENGVPDASAVWRQARALARDQALRRATRPIRTARIAACAVGASVMPLLILKPRWVWPYAPDLWRGNVASAYQPWLAGSSASLLLLTVGAAILLIGMSAWYMIREE